MDARSLAAQLGSVQIIDVREPFEWEAGHIEGARHIPMNELPQRMGEIDPQTPAVAVCFSGARSSHAARFLQSQGVHAQNLDGGLQAWIRQDLDLIGEGGEPGSLIHDPPVPGSVNAGAAPASAGAGRRADRDPVPEAIGDSAREPGAEPGSLAEGGEPSSASSSGAAGGPGGSDELSPEMEELKNNFIEAVFAAQERFGDAEPPEEEMRQFLKEWLLSKGKSPEEAEEILNR